MPHQCEKCDIRISRLDNFKVHRRVCDGNATMHKCPQCDYSSAARPSNLRRHKRRVHRSDITSDLTSEPDEELPAKRQRIVNQHHSDDDAMEPPEVPIYENEEDPIIQKLLKKHKRRIETYQRVSSRAQDRFNFQLTTPSLEHLMLHALRIHKKQRYTYKLNLSFGFVLQNILTDGYAFYDGTNNKRLFEKPIQVEKQTDLEKVREALEMEDLLEYCRQQRPNTKYIVKRITNVVFYIDKMKKFHIGCGRSLPEYIKEKSCIVSFEKDRKGVRYSDQLCAFRCLALFLEVDRSMIDREAVILSEGFRTAVAKYPTFCNGIQLEDLDQFEDVFKINVEVYSLQKVESDEEYIDAIQAVKIRSSTAKHDRTMNLNLFENHFSYIKDLNVYSSKWSCNRCEKLFDRRNNMEQHQLVCTLETKLVFPGGGYGPPKSIFDRLTEYGLDVPDNLKFYPYRIAFDFECYFKQVQQENTEHRKEVLLSELIPASVCISTNVPGEVTRKLVSNGDPQELIAKMYESIRSISDQAYNHLEPLYAEILTKLDMHVNERTLVKETCPAKAYRLQVFEKMRTDLLRWLHQIPVLGFNSGKFDINLVRQYLFPYISEADIEFENVIKRGNDYLAFHTAHARFLDIKNYVAAGTSYDKWLKANDAAQQKGYFPYEWFTCLEKLEETRLPGSEAFFSQLKDKGITQEEYDALLTLWKKQGFETMKEFLIYYNVLDTEPFLEAAEKLHQYWVSLGIDPFKGNAISLPGLALNFLTKEMEPHTILPLFPQKHEHLYHLLRANIVGGLAIVNHRYHEKDVTCLPNGEKVGWICSLDCNSLYLWGLGEETGTGVYAVWTTDGVSTESLPWKPSPVYNEWCKLKAHNMKLCFHRTYSYTLGRTQLENLEWYSNVKGKHVEHLFNGRQKIVFKDKKTRYPIDGFIPSEQRIIQFHGCHWHGHGCNLDRQPKERSAERRESTNEVTKDLIALGYIVEDKWECEWLEEKKRNPAIGNFVKKNISLQIKTNKMDGAELMSKVVSGHFFGIIECDLEVPMWSQNLIEFYEEFPPIYKITNISSGDIGDFMRTYAEANGYMKRPTRHLINSYWARKIMIATPLLRWYLSNGLHVTRIYQAIEMKPKRPFSKIRDTIVGHRRQADQDPSHKSTGEAWKTLGNSLYGKTMTRKERHKDCKVVLEDTVGQYINNKLFCKVEEVGETAYEVSMEKKKIKIDMCLTVAFFVYNTAKLRMLEFVYDFMKKYLRPGSYQTVCSDTDSIIAAYENKDLDKLVKPEMLSEYMQSGKRLFLATDTYSNRTPGLFKVEMGATKIVALCSKTYAAENNEDGTKKVSSKGLSKTTNKFLVDDFKRVLESREKGTGKNFGFRVRGDKLFQYRTNRDGLSYFYPKREVLADGVSTRALYL